MGAVQWRGKFLMFDSTVPNRPPQKNLRFTRKNARISKFFGWIREMLLCFGFPDKKVAEKKNGGARHEGFTTESVRWLGKLPQTILHTHTV